MKHLVLFIAFVTGSASLSLNAHEADHHENESGQQEAGNGLDEGNGFILKAGGGEPVINGIVIKASPKNGTEGSILVEQTFPRGSDTILHIHDQGDELFYVVSGQGAARLHGDTAPIAVGDVIFVPRGAVHRIQNFDNDAPLVVIFFMDSPKLAEQFRVIHERRTANPDSPITDEERLEIERRIGGAREVK